MLPWLLLRTAVGRQRVTGSGRSRTGIGACARGSSEGHVETNPLASQSYGWRVHREVVRGSDPGASSPFPVTV